MELPSSMTGIRILQSNLHKTTAYDAIGALHRLVSDNRAASAF